MTTKIIAPPQRRWSLRLRVIAAVVFAALTPQLVVVLWSRVDLSVSGEMWGHARDAADQAAQAIADRPDLPKDALQQIAAKNRVRLRVVDVSSGAAIFEADANDPGDSIDRIESFFLGENATPSSQELDVDLGPILPRAEVQSALRTGEYVGCNYLPFVHCQAARALPTSAPTRVVHAETTSRRAVFAVYGLRHQLLRIALITLPLSLILAIYTGRRVVSPIENLRRQTLARANAASPSSMLDPERRDEVGVLADAFNALLATLETKRTENEAFAADLVHEMKNPLAALRAAGEALTNAPLEAERVERLARVLRDGTKKLDVLVTQFLELARAEAGLPNEERSDVDVNAIVAALLGGLKNDPRCAEITFELENKSNSQLMVRGVAGRIEALFRELLENGASFAGEGGKVSATLFSIADEVVVRITDSGPGIKPEDLPRVFQRFFTTRGERRGTGLGLALVEAVATAHGGRVRAFSEAGEGAIFEVRLPRADA
ncbi:MAG: HAMP domain-containing sensor histidine kinase [Polyangiaceae bacterium]